MFHLVTPAANCTLLIIAFLFMPGILKWLNTIFKEHVK
jgi:hypothetical protein